MDTPRFVLYVSHRENGHYQHLTARVMALAEDDTPRNIPTDDAYRVSPYGGIVATAQADDERWDGGRTFSYAWRLGIAGDVHDVIVAEQVEAAVATLRKVRKVLARVEAESGPALTFGQYVARIATALRIPVLTGTSGASGWYSDGRYVTWRPGDAVSIVDGWTAEFRADVSAA